MKKIFTILAAALFCTSMMADEAILSWYLGTNGNEATGANSITGATGSAAEGFTIAITGNDSKNWAKGGGDITYNGNSYKTLKNSNGSQNTITLPTGCTASQVDFYVTANADSDAKLSEINGETCNDAVTSHKDYSNPTHITKTLDNVNSFTFTFSTKQVCLIAVVTFTPAEVAEPVGKVTISGPETGFVGRTVTLTATTDVKADTVYWTVDGAVQDSHAKTLNLELTAARTYQVACFARNANNAVDEWIIGEHAVVATVKPVLEPISVNETTVWDWTKAATVSTIQWSGDNKDADPVLLANVDDFNNNADFNSQALLFSGEYPIRDGKFCQGKTLIFTTTAAGTVKLDFSNTGNNAARFVKVNEVVSTAVSSANSTKVESAEIAVPAGQVTIHGALEDGTEQYLRVYKLTFTKGESTAIDNINATEKAVKVIENGQLVIIKNGVRYNTLGAQL